METEKEEEEDEEAPEEQEEEDEEFCLPVSATGLRLNEDRTGSWQERDFTDSRCA